MRLSSVLAASALLLVACGGSDGASTNDDNNFTSGIVPPRFAAGTNYLEVRTSLLQQGWQPYHADDADECDAEFEPVRCQPELEAASGTGEAFAEFLWWKSNVVLRVSTRGDDPVTFISDDLPDTSPPGRPVSTSATSPTSGPIPQDLLRATARFQVVTQLMNCRKDAGTDSAVLRQFSQGRMLNQQGPVHQVVEDAGGRAWILVKADDEGPNLTPCWVSANYTYIAPR